MFVIKRSPHNPILIPQSEHPWEARATFNWSPIKIGKKLHILYRAIGKSSFYESATLPLSIIGQAESRDGVHFKNRKPFIVPEKEWEKFGCEDPRITFFEGKYYIFYTALSEYPFRADGIKVALATSLDLKKIESKHLITSFNAKAMAMFPNRINGKITLIFTVNTDRPPAKIAIAQFEKEEDLWSKTYWDKWYGEIDRHIIDDPRRNSSDHVEVGAPPIKTPHGWLLIYSHIQNYFPTEERLDKIFGIEALLLDLNDPRVIIGRTRGPMFAPQEPYELNGIVPNIIFPSGALINGKNLDIYYGSADTTGGVAKVCMADLLASIYHWKADISYFTRYNKNPILSPRSSDSAWESKAVFNPAAIDLRGKIHLLYRAMSEDNTSTIGYAASLNGFDIVERLDKPIYIPKEDFELKKIQGNSGCEDPRLTKIGNNIYMCYTAFDGIGPPRVAITSITVKDFLAKKWDWTKAMPITPRNIDDKDACLLPQKLKGKYVILHRIGTDICIDYVKSLDFEKSQVTRCIRILGPRPNMWDSEKVGIAAPPIKTNRGWLLLYHGISKGHKTYRVGAALLKLSDPTIVLARLTDPILEPKTLYEKEGQVHNVVFPCGAVVRNGVVYTYYGAADSVIGVATMKLKDLLRVLK